MLGLFFIFVFVLWVSVISMSRTNGFAGAYQLISNIKPMLLVLTGFALRKDIRIEKSDLVYCQLVIGCRWLFLLRGSGYLRGVISAYYPGGPKGSDLSPISFVPTRAFGFFDHPAMMATYAVYMAFLGCGCLY